MLRRAGRIPFRFSHAAAQHLCCIMDGLPTPLQQRIYVQAGVNNVDTTCRNELFRTALLVDQRDAHASFTNDQDSPAPHITWRVASMVREPTETQADFVTALRRIAQRFSRLQHISVDVSAHGRPADSTMEGLDNFVKFVVPRLGAAARLTLRGTMPGRLPLAALLPLNRLMTIPLAATPRVDITLPRLAAAHLLTHLASFFPAAQEVRVRMWLASSDPDRTVVQLRAPDSLLHLHTVLTPAPAAAVPPVSHTLDLTIRQARRLQVLVCRCDRGGALGATGLSDRIHVRVDDAPALHTVRGHPHMSPLACDGAPALLHIQAAIADVPLLGGEATSWVRNWLLLWGARQAGLTSLQLLLSHPVLLSQKEEDELMAWAATHLRFRLVGVWTS